MGQTAVYALDENGKLSLSLSGPQGRQGLPWAPQWDETLASPRAPTHKLCKPP